jgi:hypothetical protein
MVTPAPESSLAWVLLLLALWCGVAATLGPVIGRMLKRNAERYPVVERENAPEP